MSNGANRLDRVGCLMAETELERMKDEATENDIMPIVWRSSASIPVHRSSS